jgi:membrane-bound lytic murein transglycosylase F
MGFQYELLQQLSNDLGVKLEIKVSNNLDETFEGIKNGTFDVVAKNLTVTRKRKQEVDFTAPLLHTRQVLVQRKKSKNSNDSVYINGTLQLAGKTIYVQHNTSYFRRLESLSNEIEKDITIIQDTVYGVEQLVSRVAEGEIDYTVCDENLATLYQTYYPNLDISLRLSYPQKIAWAIRKGSVEWKKYLDNWILTFKTTRKYSQLFHKYFESPRIAQRMKSDYHSIYGGNISDYDEMIKKIAEKYNWDWRLIASVIYHESRFNEEAGSWAGAYGLMQLVSTTADAFGIEDYTQPDQNIEAGILFLNWLNDRFIESIPDSVERVNFVLASYNIGFGHVTDAQHLAEKFGKNPFIWKDNVDEYLLKKSEAKYYNDSVVQYGYCRGKEAVDYVQRVTDNYEHYLNLIEK